MTRQDQRPALEAQLPEPAFRLRWDACRAVYTVSKPNIGDTDCYTADQLQAAIAHNRQIYAWVSESIAEHQKVEGRQRRIWWENNERVGMPIYAAPQPAEPDPTLPYEQALSELIDKIVPGLDSGDILADAQTASDLADHVARGERWRVDEPVFLAARDTRVSTSVEHGVDTLDAQRWRKARALPRSWWRDAFSRIAAEGVTLDQLIDAEMRRRLP